MTRSALVITVDRLSPSFLGPYGGTAAATPNFNRLAARSLVIENAISDAAELDAVFRSYWQGVHACVPAARVAAPSLLERLRAAQIRTLLVTDDPAVAGDGLAEFFDERVLLPASSNDACVADVETTQLAQSLAAGLDALADLPSPFLLWIHLRGMGGPWDAPLELRESLRSDDDPPPRETARVPSLVLDAGYDPDTLVSITQAYAAQMMLLDMGLGVLLDALDAHPARDELLLLLTSPRGFPLGEHLIVGDAEPALYGELVHVPLFVHRGDGVGAMARDQALVQPADIAATLADWFDAPRAKCSPKAASLLPLTTDFSSAWPREQTLSIAPSERATRTAAWFLRSAKLEDGERVELFSKPDDRFEANEVASRVPQIAESLAASIAELEQALIADDFTQLAPLAPEIVGQQA